MLLFCLLFIGPPRCLDDCRQERGRWGERREGGGKGVKIKKVAMWNF